ncbi:MAG: RHS repeat-associated core domain-containing protein [Bryobacteraceae bacterium]
MGAFQLTYDAEERLLTARASSTSTSISYAYDGTGQLVGKSIHGGSTTLYVHDAFGNLAAEYSSGTPASAPCTTCYLIQDHLGSTRMVTDGAGNVVGRHDYLPFGVEIPAGYTGRTSLWAAADTVDTRFTGQDRDTDTGLDRFPARYMGSAEGRFMVPDPIGSLAADPANPQSWNLYSYVRNNPLALIDPTGLTSCDANGDNCSDSVTVNGGGGDGLPVNCFFYSFLCGGDGFPGPGGTTPPPPPTPPLTPPPPPKSGGVIKSIFCGAFSGLVNAAAPRNLNSTIGVGAGGSAGVGFILGIAASVGIQAVADSHSNLGIAFNVGGNPGYGVFGVGATGGVQGSYSTASTIYGLRGFSAGAGITAGPGGVDAAVSSGATVTGTFGVGAGTKGAALSLNYTWVPSALSTNCRQ